MRKDKFHEHLGEEQVFGSPNVDFLKHCRLNQHSHPMDWVNTLLPITPADNLEDDWAENVKENGTAEFSISNWTTFTSTKAMVCNETKRGSFWMKNSSHLKNSIILKMIEVYILDGLSTLLQLIQKHQPQSNEPPQNNKFIATYIGPGFHCVYCSFCQFMVDKIHLVFHHHSMNVPISKLMSSTTDYNMYQRRLRFLARISPPKNKHEKCSVRASLKLALANSNNSGMVSKPNVLWRTDGLWTFTSAKNLCTIN